MAVFDGVRYSLSPSLSPTRASELAAVLELNGAAPHPPYTHLVAPSASHAHNDATADSLKLVTDRWVDRSIVMGKRQPEQYYSPDPAMIFSGVVACATDLSVPDLEVLSAGITALGGQWRIGLTRDVTHLFALRTGSDKYNTAVHFAPQTHMCILTPHWFDDAVRLGRRIPETPYAWPDPTILRPGLALDLNKDSLVTEGRQKRKPTGDAEGETSDGTNQGEHACVWAGRRILLSTSLELGDGSRRAIEAGIERAGGVVVPISDSAEEDVEENALDDCDVLITRWRSGKPYFKAARRSLLIGTLSWLFSVESSGTLHSPLDSLLWYPTPRGGIPDLVDCEISITNYTGAARDYLKRLILLIGAKFTPSMSQSNKVLVAGFQPSPKTTRALSWSIPVVNHTWLEDCFVEWRALTVGLERYIVYPPGIDFGKLLMTRQDGPSSSQSLPNSRLRGGAVPGGRGIGIINVDQEEMRDSETACHLSTMREVFANDTTTDGMSIAQLEGNLPTESRARSRSRTGSVKKTPSSARIKPRTISTPVTSSATGVFVDRVIELPSDDGEENVSGRRHTFVNNKRAATSPVGLRPSSQSASRPSSVARRKAEVVTHDLGGSSEGWKNKKGQREAESAVEAMEQQQALHEDIAQPARPAYPKPRLVQRESGLQTARSPVGNEEQEQALAQLGKLDQRAKVMTIGSDSEMHTDAGETSEVSIPPRRATGAGSATPIKSGMKPRLRSKSRSRPASVPGGEGGDEVVVGKEKRNSATRSQLPMRLPSPTSPDPKSSRTPKRRLSVVVPPVPKDYFSSQSLCITPEGEAQGDRMQENDRKIVDGAAVLEPRHKRLMPVASVSAIAAEASTPASKRGKPSPAKIPMSGKSNKAKTKPTVSKPAAKTRGDDTEADMDDVEEDDRPTIIDTPMTSSSRGGPKRGAANKATTRLREVIMPDVIDFEIEQKLAKRRRNTGGESVASISREEDQDKEERSKKKRRVTTVEEAEVEDVLIPSIKAKQKRSDEKGMTKGSAADSEKEIDEPQAKSKPNGPREKKGSRGGGKELATIRLMTTGVSLSDDVVKRLAKLGIQMTTKPTDCTHLVAKGIVRTEKFLCAMSVSPYILTEEWADASAKGGKLLPENDYLLSDMAAERKWAFKFADAMARARAPEGGSSLFKQMTFYVTPKVTVDVKLLKNVISAGGGQVQTSTTPTVRILRGNTNRYVVSCQEDKAIWRPLVQEGFKVYSPELVLRAALRQEIEWERVECLVAG